MKESRSRKFEAGLLTKEQYERYHIRAGRIHPPLGAYLCVDTADYINGQVFHVEKGRINTYYFGEDRMPLCKGGDGMLRSRS